MQCTSYQHSPAVIYLNLAFLQEGSSRRYLSLEVAVPSFRKHQGQSSEPQTIAQFGTITNKPGGGMGLSSFKGSQITSTCAGAQGHVDRGQNPAHSGSTQHASGLAGCRGRGGQVVVE
jgi:hypothetical protein